MNTTLDSATVKLTTAEPPYEIVNLPDINDKLWDDIRKEYGLTLPELGALKSQKGNMKLYLSSHFSIAMSALKSLYISHLISPTRLLLSVK
jgi:hypothetical protein